jgi:hypothetical protein
MQRRPSISAFMNIGLMRLLLEIALPTFRCHGKQSVKIRGRRVNFLATPARRV